MQKVKLVGEIAKFGSSWETNCATIADIFKLIDCQTPGFRQHLVEGAEAGVGYTIKRGKDYLEEGEELLLSLNDEDIIITEIPAGAKSGMGKVIAGLAIIAISLIPGVGQFLGPKLTMMLFTVGANLTMTGIAQLMAPGPETDKQQEEGYLFQGPTNNMQQGLPVPVCYGELIVGGAPMSLSFRPDFTNSYQRGRGHGVISYGIGGYYVAYNNFLKPNSPDIAVPNDNNEFEAAA
tara:strand:+ start:2800 stop:3504 length:705 start_codon:yes stop_codon:yes gene_type:complete